MSEYPSDADGSTLTTTFLHWTFSRAVLHRGYVLASSLYFVTSAHLSGYELLVLAIAMSVTLLASVIPAGVWSDAFSRKWPLVLGHGFLAAGMVMTGLVTAFPLLVMTQVLWGLGWAFSTGADVAWVTDEFDRPDLIVRVLVSRARWDLIGGAAGIVVFGALGWAIGLAATIVISGIAMGIVGLCVAMRFREDNFTPEPQPRLKRSGQILRAGLALSRRDHEILIVLAATLIINGAATISWIFPRRLIDLGYPSNPVIWYTGLNILTFGIGVVALQLVQARLAGTGAARRTYALACFLGALGLLVLAYAPNVGIGSLGVLIVGGISFNVTRTVSVIWVNGRTPSHIRTTMHSFLSQAESIGEVLGAAALAGLAAITGVVPTIAASAALLAVAGIIVVRSRADRSPSGSGQERV